MEDIGATIATFAVLVLVYLFTKPSSEVKKAIAERHGLTPTRAGLRGVFAGRSVDIRSGTTGSYRNRRTYTGLRVDLASPPELLLSTENMRTRVAKWFGKDDLRTGAHEFDDIFHVQGLGEAEILAWLTPTRQQLLLELREVANFVEISRGELRFQFSAAAVSEDEIESTLRFAVESADRIEAGRSWPIAALTLETWGTTGRWHGLGAFIATGIWVAGMSFVIGLVAWIVWPDPEAKQRELDRLRKNGTELETCVSDLELTWDVDLTVCDEALAGVEDVSTRTMKVAATLHQIRARQSSRVTIDKAAATVAFHALEHVADSSTQLAVAWDMGLMEEYRRVAYERNPPPHITLLLDIPVDRTSGGALHAARCLMVEGRGVLQPRNEVEIACAGLHGDAIKRPNRRLKDEETVASYEVETPTEFDVRDRYRPKTSLFSYAVALAAGEEATLATDPWTLAPACDGAWNLPSGFGRPDVWEAAAQRGPEEAELMLTISALLRWAMGDASGVVPHIENPRLALCHAQILVASGDPVAAKELLDAHEFEEELTALVDVTRAEAALAAGDWQSMGEHAMTAVSKLGTVLRGGALAERAGIYLTLAALQTADVRYYAALESTFGAMVEPDQFGGDAVASARWYADASTDEFPNESSRWAAPDAAILVPGAEAAIALIVGALADGGDVEYWLDVNLPEAFDSYRLAEGRHLAAKLRDDSEGVARWAAILARLKLKSPSAVRLRDLAMNRRAMSR